MKHPDEILMAMIEANNDTPGDTMTAQEFHEHDNEIRRQVVHNHFGSWDYARKKAGILTEIDYKPSKEDYLKDMKRVKEEQGDLKVKTYEEHGKFSPYTAYKKFESFTAAREMIQDD